jgi:hypothetical protein
LSGMVWCRVRWQTSSLPSFSITAATTLFIIENVGSEAQAPEFSHTGPISHLNFAFPALLRFLQLFAHNFSAVLDEILVLDAEGCGKMAVDVEFAGDLVFHENRHNDF